MKFYKETSLEEIEKLRDEFFEEKLGGWYKGTGELHQALSENKVHTAKVIFGYCENFNTTDKDFKYLCDLYKVMRLLEKGEKIYTDL